MSGRRSPSTVETMCITLEKRSTSISSVGRTLPGTHTRPRSLRARSTSIACSACSLGSASSSCSSRRSRTSVSPRGRVPAIGRVSTRLPSTRTSGSGEEPASSMPSGPQVEHVRRRVRDAQPSVDGQPAVGRRERHAPRRHRLEDVAGEDVLLEARRRCRGSRHRPCSARRSASEASPADSRGSGRRRGELVGELLERRHGRRRSRRAARGRRGRAAAANGRTRPRDRSTGDRSAGPAASAACGAGCPSSSARGLVARVAHQPSRDRRQPVESRAP